MIDQWFREIRITHSRILFVGIGNVLRSDDGIGVYISQRLKETPEIRSLTVEMSIENYIGKINTMNPDLLILVDCVDFNRKPGYYRVLPVDKLRGQTTNTHNISLQQIGRLFHMPVWILGIQPEHLGFGEELTLTVKTSADDIIYRLNKQILQANEPESANIHFTENRNQ